MAVDRRGQFVNVFERDQILQHVVVPPHIEIELIREGRGEAWTEASPGRAGEMRVRGDLPSEDSQPFGMRHGHRGEKNFFCEREDRGVRADAEGKRDYRYGRESFILTQHSQSVAAVAAEFVPQAEAERFAAVLLVHFDATEL